MCWKRFHSAIAVDADGLRSVIIYGSRMNKRKATAGAKANVNSLAATGIDDNVICAGRPAPLLQKPIFVRFGFYFGLCGGGGDFPKFCDGSSRDISMDTIGRLDHRVASRIFNHADASSFGERAISWTTLLGPIDVVRTATGNYVRKIQIGRQDISCR